MAPNTIETVRLLLVSNEVSVLRLLNSAVQSNSWHLETSSNGWDAMERVQSERAPHLLLLDLPRGDGDSLHLLPWLRRLRPELPIVVLCDAQDADNQKEATRMGAKDVLMRPATEEQIESVVRRQLGSHNDSVEPEIASEDIESVGEDEFFLSISPIMQQLRAQTELLAQADVPVLILGEPGSGKGTVARLIHQMSVYSGFNFLRVNCAEMPGDLLEIELFGRENRSEGSSKGLGKLEMRSEGYAAARRDFADAAGVAVQVAQSSARPAFCSARGIRRPSKPTSAFSPPAATNSIAHWPRSDWTLNSTTV